MTDHELPALTRFEDRLARDLVSMSAAALRPGSARALAADAIAAGRPRRISGFVIPIRWLVVAGLALVLLAAGMLASAGAFRARPSLPATGRLAYVTASDPAGNDQVLHVVSRDGTGADIATIGGGWGLWSGTGHYLLVDGGPDVEGTDFAVLDPDGAPVGAIPLAQNPTPAWAPRSDRLALASQTPTGPRLRLFAPDGALMRELRVPPGVQKLFEPIWSPDERHIMIAGCAGCLLSEHDSKHDYVGRQEVWLIDAFGDDDPVRLAGSPDEGYDAGRWLSDDEVTYSAYCQEPPACGPDHPLTADGVYAATWWAVRVDGSGRRPDATTAPDARYSPDGLLDAWTGGGHLLVDRVAGGDRRQVAGAPEHSYVVAWSPDQAQLLYVKADADALLAPDETGPYPGALWMVDVDGSDNHQVSATGRWGSWQPLPDGER